MIMTIIDSLGPWVWVAFGLLLLGFEMLAPSTFLLWPGIAAVIVGFVTLILGTESDIWPWQAQIVAFLVLSLLTAWYGKKYVKQHNLEESDKPGLNDRSIQLVGQTAILKEAISEGYGRAKIGDTTWRVKGEDAKAGTRVKVVGADGSLLLVEMA